MDGCRPWRGGKKSYKQMNLSNGYKFLAQGKHVM